MRRTPKAQWVHFLIGVAALNCSSCSRGDESPPPLGSNTECLDLEYFRLEDGGLPAFVRLYDVFDAGAHAVGCRRGHHCLGFSCDEQCDPALCGAHEDCVSATGTCRYVECSERVACGPGFICESRSRRCFPANGDCRSSLVCPDFGGEQLNSVATVSCMANGLCAVRPKTGPPPFFDVTEEISVITPTRGARLTATTQPEFRWRAFPNAASLLLVASQWPVDSATLANSAVWGAAVAPGTDSVNWQAGKPVEQGRWIDAAPVPLTTGSYFFVVQAVINGSLEAGSSVIPFVVGEATPWKQSGDACTLPGLPGDCGNPSSILSCFDGSCRKVCASDVECESTHSCGEPTVSGYRLCDP